jgi:hypothetical protein
VKFKCSGICLQRTSPLPQITQQKNPQDKPKNGQCVYQSEYRYVSHIHQGACTHASLVVDLPSNDSGSNEQLDDQIEEAENIQPNDNML